MVCLRRCAGGCRRCAGRRRDGIAAGLLDKDSLIALGDLRHVEGAARGSAADGEGVCGGVLGGMPGVMGTGRCSFREPGRVGQG
jgi:hypothetical protein